MLNLDFKVNIYNDGKLVEENIDFAKFLDINSSETSIVIDIINHCLPIIREEQYFVEFEEMHSGKWLVTRIKTNYGNDKETQDLYNTHIMIFNGEEQPFVGTLAEYIECQGGDADQTAHYFEGYSDLLNGKEYAIMSEFGCGEYIAVKIGKEYVSKFK